MASNKILVPGSFDPVTRAHVELFRVGAKLGELIVGIGRNADKPRGCLLPATRKELIQRTLLEECISGRVEIYDNLLADFARKEGVVAIVRGIRNTSDVLHETGLADYLAEEGCASAVWVPTPPAYRSLSSSFVRELLQHDHPDNRVLSRYVPASICRCLGNNALRLRARFRDLWRKIGAIGDLDSAFEDLLLRYSLRTRAYHTMEHIAFGLKSLDEILPTLAADGKDLYTPAIEWAFFFHDADDDEQGSAALANSVAMQAGLRNGYLLERVEKMILASGHREFPQTVEEKVICDADLSIFGSDIAKFDRYEAQVRQEWSHTPEDVFKRERAKILRRFLDRPSIYGTDYGRRMWEERARENLDRSIRRLGRPEGSGPSVCPAW